MSNYYTLLTHAGAAKEAAKKSAGETLELTHIAVGDGNGAVYEPTTNATELKNEQWRGEIQNHFVHPNNAAWYVVEVYIPESVGGWNIVEAALLDSDGVMYAIAKYPSTYKPSLTEGAGKGIWVRLIIEQTTHDSVQISIDPSVSIASREYVDELKERMGNLGVDDIDGLSELLVSKASSRHSHSASAITSGTLNKARLPSDTYFPSGTRMLFQQTTAPLGWTKVTTHNDKALRVVSGSVGSGGSKTFTSAFGTPSVSGSVTINGAFWTYDNTLSNNETSPHRHESGWYGPRAANGTANIFASNQPSDGTVYTGYTGGGQGHKHGVGHNLSGSILSANTAINVQYVDIIIATKD